VRGHATTVQINLDKNGANGVYKGTMPTSGCPTDFQLVSRNDNGFVFGTQVPGSPYATNAPMNSGTGTPYGGVNVGNQLGRVEIAVAPSNPNYITRRSPRSRRTAPAAAVTHKAVSSAFSLAQTAAKPGAL
jgi:hypothetical protein